MPNTRKVLSSRDLKARLKAGGIITISDVLIVENVDIIQTDINCQGIEFINCGFQGFLGFSDLSLEFGVKLTYCDIDTNFLFTNCKVTGFEHGFNFDGYSILITSSKINGAFSAIGCELNRGIGVKTDLEIGSVFIKDNALTYNGLYFEGGVLKNHCDIENNSIPMDIRFDNYNINSQVRISNNKTSGLVFVKSKFSKDLHLWGGQTRGIIFNDGVFEDDVHIKAIKATDTLTIIGGDFQTSLNVEYTDTTNNISGGCDKIYLHSCSFGNGINFIGSRNLTQPYDLKTVTIVSTEKLKGEILFRNFNIEEVDINGFNANATIKFIHLNVIKFRMNEFTNSSKVQLYDVKAKHDSESSFEIFNSNLGTFEFYNTFLSSFKKIFIRSSVVSDIVTSNVTWFKREMLDAEKNYSKSALASYWNNNREVFRQLKYAMDKQGNRIQALEFKSYEMDAYRKELKTQPLTIDNFANKIILWLSQSNNHGINWFKPASLIIGFTLLFYWLIVISISDKLYFSPAESMADLKGSMDEFKNYSSAIFKMVNPVFIFDKAFKGVESKTFVTSLLEFLHRITLAYLLFQMVSAFRKFVK